MAVNNQKIEKKFAIYNGDSCEVMKSLPDECLDLSIYSPPFPSKSGGCLYHYSSSDRDLSNCKDYDEFFKHYEFIVKEKFRLTKPGRMSAVHCMDVPSGNTGHDYRVDFPGDIIRLHESMGWKYIGRYCIWKEPFAVRLRTMAKSLAHKTIVDNSLRCSNAAADFLVMFERDGENQIPVTHPVGLTEYAGERKMPSENLKYRGWTGDQKLNKFSHWIWRQYASSFWDDIRLGNVLPYKEGTEEDDEKHVHPLQLDVIERALVLWSNPGEVVFTPFMGVGSEVYGSLINGRKGIGIELKPSYYRQAERNLKHALEFGRPGEQMDLIDITTPISETISGESRLV